MNEPYHENASGNSSIWHVLFRHQLPLQHETALFVLVSFLDLLMTYLLLLYSAHDLLNRMIVESNPLAQLYLDRWGFKGMVYLKFSLVTVVIFLAQIIALRKLTTARVLLNAATIILSAVVIYSFTVYLRADGWL